MAFEAQNPKSQQKGHEYYAQLCALYTSGCLTEQEQMDLNAHLQECRSCAKLLLSYRAVARSAASLLPPIADAGPSVLPESWSVENAKKQLLNRIEAYNATHRPQQVKSSRPRPSPLRALAPLTVAAVLLVSLLAAASYRLGKLRGQRLAEQVLNLNATKAQAANRADSLGQQRAALEQKLATLSGEVQRLEEALERQAATMAEARVSKDQLEHKRAEQNSVIGALGSEKSALAAERDAAVRKLQETQDSLNTVHQRLQELQGEHDRQLLHTASLQMRVDELSSTLKDSEDTVRRAERLLVSDRDIRELMGARELYIADVFDIDRDGKTQKAFGRVFYTGGKSLIFYAFDLDRQPGVREASTFQAWGRRGPGDKRPLNMGVLYLDNSANHRWVLRFEDPKVLNEIDAVFVTVEPKSGEQKPTGKQLLFASLRTPPNHP